MARKLVASLLVAGALSAAMRPCSLPRLLLSAVLIYSNMALANDPDWYTDDLKSPIFRIYGIAAHEGGEVRTSEVFRTNKADVVLAPGGYVEINGSRLQGEPVYTGSIVKTQVGYRYKGVTPHSGKKYEFHFVRAPGQEYRHSMDIEPFSVSLPASISKREHLVISIVGAPLRYRLNPLRRDDSTYTISRDVLAGIPESSIRLFLSRAMLQPLEGFPNPAYISGGYDLKPISVRLVD